MADYYPLLAKAAAGLPDQSVQARQAMYERARKALLGQLRAIDPPAEADDIAREGAALDAAIARVEADLFSVVPAEPASLSPAMSAATSVETPAQVPLATATDAALDTADASTGTSPADAKVETTDTEERAEPESLLRPRARPPAPTPPAPRSPRNRLWILGGVVAVVVAAVAVAALKLRNSPDDLARLKPVTAPTAETNASGKIAERVGRDDPAPATNGARATAVAGVASTARPPTPSNAPTVTQAPIPIAQRAALLIEAPDLESKVRTFIGSAVWRLDNVQPASGQPLGTAVHADVDIPEAKVRMSFDLRKNTDPALPAASTIEIRFTLLPGSIFPGINQISVPQMRREENPNGDGLAGVPVKITDTYFLVGLAQGDIEKRNNDFVLTRNWIDIPIQLSDNRIAKITIEKGPTGERILADALSTWSQ